MFPQDPICEQTPLHRRRLVILFLVLAIFFSLLLVQFYRIQIIQGEKWLRQANAQHQLTVIEPCKRGVFYSNTTMQEGHGEPPVAFVTDIVQYHVYADTTVLSDECKESILEYVSATLRMNTKQKNTLSYHLHKRSRGRKLCSYISAEEQLSLEKWWLPFAKANRLPRNALFFVQDFKRSYPYGKMLGQILHTVRNERDPKTHHHIPTGGLELSLDPYLRGKEGKRTLLRSPRNALDLGTITVEPKNGSDIYLTVNHYLQAITEEELSQGVIRAGAKSGWAIMMDPYTGHILSWAQYPWFFPEQYAHFFNTPSLLPETKVKAIADPFEPGSTMKPITMLICLKANEELQKQGKPPIFSPEEKIATTNGMFPGRSKPIHDVRTHHFLNMYMALQKSSNIYMAKIVHRLIEALGETWYRDCLSEIFGFGKKTGIELSSESPGLLPSPHKKHPNGSVQWSKPTPYSLSFGHNILTNTLQMLRAYSLIANGGYPVQPTLIKKIITTNPDGSQDVLLDNDAKVRDNLQPPLFSQESIQAVTKGLMYATKPGGAAARADIFGYTEAGKTATSEKIINGTYSKKSNISTFIGWSPAQHPRFVMIIVIDEPEKRYIPGIGGNQYGGVCAAPIFREIGKRTLEYLGVEPDDPFGFPPGDPRHNGEKAIWHKEAKSLTNLYTTWNTP